jgi:FAD/FMN-containing dehydrogenase
MAYGRINVNPTGFMEEAILSTFQKDTSRLIPLRGGQWQTARRTVFRASANSSYGKDLRWKTEKLFASQLSGRKFSRNQLQNEGVEVFENRDTAYTDILHEYFIPASAFVPFLQALKQALPQYKVDLLNITVRNVQRDSDSYLCYAREDVFGFVMLFNQRRDKTAEAEMQRLTQRLIDISASLHGTYYLVYRLHATRQQLYSAYPQAGEFFALKRKYDPAEVFQNGFYTHYR